MSFASGFGELEVLWRWFGCTGLLIISYFVIPAFAQEQLELEGSAIHHGSRSLQGAVANHGSQVSRAAFPGGNGLGITVKGRV